MFYTLGTGNKAAGNGVHEVAGSLDAGRGVGSMGRNGNGDGKRPYLRNGEGLRNAIERVRLFREENQRPPYSLELKGLVGSWLRSQWRQGKDMVQIRGMLRLGKRKIKPYERKVLSKNLDRDREIVALRSNEEGSGAKMRLAEIGRRFRISRQRVHQIVSGSEGLKEAV
ncbi:MAG: hypothetical protein KGH94_02700 [Candidatus Micrarchaeota archaeon]|nr:hypothetical protein [Candidatus Micrarchaeota archaeon]